MRMERCLDLWIDSHRETGMTRSMFAEAQCERRPNHTPAGDSCIRSARQ